MLYTGTGKMIISDGIDLIDDKICPRVDCFLVCQSTRLSIFFKKKGKKRKKWVKIYFKILAILVYIN